MGLKKTIGRITGVTAAGIALAYGADGWFNNGEDMLKPTGRWLVNRFEDFIDGVSEQDQHPFGLSADPYYALVSLPEADHHAATLPPYPGSLATSRVVNVDLSVSGTRPDLQG